MAMSLFSTTNLKTALIEYARGRPMIWDRNVACTKKDREAAWFPFADGFSIPVHEAKKRWEGMRRMYCHELKKFLNNNDRSDWQFFPALDVFLRRPVEMFLKKEKEMKERGSFKGPYNIHRAGRNAFSDSKKPKVAFKAEPLPNIESASMVPSTKPSVGRKPDALPNVDPVPRLPLIVAPARLPDTRKQPSPSFLKPNNNGHAKVPVVISRSISTTGRLPAKRKISDKSAEKPCPLSKKRASTSGSPPVTKQQRNSVEGQESAIAVEAPTQKPQPTISVPASIQSSTPIRKFSIPIDKSIDLFADVVIEPIPKPSIKKDQSFPSTSQSAPSTSQSAPCTSQSASSTSQSVPSTSQSTPSTSQSTPSTSQSTPSTSQLTANSTSQSTVAEQVETKDENNAKFEIKILQTSTLTSIESQLMMWCSELETMKSESAQLGGVGPQTVDPNKEKEARKNFLISFLSDMEQMSQEQRRFFKAKLMSLVCAILDSNTS